MLVIGGVTGWQCVYNPISAGGGNNVGGSIVVMVERYGKGDNAGRIVMMTTSRWGQKQSTTTAAVALDTGSSWHTSVLPTHATAPAARRVSRRLQLYGDDS